MIGYFELETSQQPLVADVYVKAAYRSRVLTSFPEAKRKAMAFNRFRLDQKKGLEVFGTWKSLGDYKVLPALALAAAFGHS